MSINLFCGGKSWGEKNRGKQPHLYGDKCSQLKSEVNKKKVSFTVVFLKENNNILTHSSYLLKAITKTKRLFYKLITCKAFMDLNVINNFLKVIAEQKTKLIATQKFIWFGLVGTYKLIATHKCIWYVKSTQKQSVEIWNLSQGSAIDSANIRQFKDGKVSVYLQSWHLYFKSLNTWKKSSNIWLASYSVW